ncbi:hypothetical protein [Plantactinospora sp. CA-290183]|uniref:hypothetical protein n=1 Tax=Plantactinospora sp. CA-290183 TaxID=3240006 RepID=UPI003D91B619
MTPTLTPAPWWGQIIDRDGRRVRRVAHVLRTGESPPPDDEVDVALDDEEPPELEAWIDDCLGAGVSYNTIVREGVARYRVSEATMKRRIRNVRGDRAA